MAYVPGCGPISQEGNWYGCLPRLAVVSEYPGKEEVKTGRGLTGPSGAVLWPLVWRECGVKQEGVWTTNLIKEPQRAEWERKGVPAEVLEAAGRELELELQQVEPKVVLAMGRHAIRHFLGEWAQVETVNAQVYEIERPWGTVTVVPCTHTAAAMRDGSRLAWTQEAIAVLGRVLRGEGPPSAPKDHRVTVYSDFDEWAAAEQPELADTIALDTEWLPDGRPWGLSAAVSARAALVLKAHQTTGLQKLRHFLLKRRPRVALHYALADLGPLRRMDIDLRAMGLEIVDTNVLAFHKGTEPQGLKALCRRHLGLAMRDYEDVVGPYHQQALHAYLGLAWEVTRPSALFERRGKPSKSCPLGKLLKPRREKASREHRLLEGCFRDLRKGKTVDLWSRWCGWDPEVRQAIIDLVGPVPLASLDLVPEREAIQYSGEDAAGTIGILRVLEGMKRHPTIEVTDHAVIPVVDDMQQRGMEVDLQAHAKLQQYLRDELAESLEVLRLLTDDPHFSPDSPDDVRRVLYGLKKVGRGQYFYDPDDDEDYVIPPARTKTGLPSTDKKSLSLLKNDHLLPVFILQYRQLKKLESTYIAPLTSFLDAGNVLHPRYSTTRVPSGRLAARDPNIMAFPKRSELGMMTRGLFRARKGCEYGAWDHGQIELRVLADDARDEAMIAELQPGAADMHRANAIMWYGLDVDVWDDAYWKGPGKVVRDMSKINTYGLAYGAEERRLHFEALVAGFTKYDVDDFARFRKDWFTKYHGVATMVQETEAFIRQHGYVEDRWGRPRKLPAVFLTGYRWPVAKLREEAIRQGFNHRIQGGARGFIQRAEIRAQHEVFPVVREMGWGVWPILDYHDEVIVEFELGAWDLLNPLMQWAMTADSPMMRVPIVTDAEHGPTWAALK